VITFEYQGVPGAAGSDILRPLIPLWIRGPRQVPEQVALVDTGADDVLIPHYLGVRLGLALRPENRVLYSGVTGSVLAYPERINLMITDGATHHIWSATIYVHEGGNMQVLLGRSGFLEHFTATFNGAADRFSLIQNGTFPPPIFRF
jgi:gag-polyprotein putative aspartyl protease